MPVSIEIFGIKGYVYDSIRSLLLESLDDTGIEYVLRDFQEIDQFIAEGIDSVPTIRVNHKTGFTKTENKTAEELVASIVNHVIELDAPKILCPVDFSERSIQAASWASELAHVLRMQLKLVHVVRPMSESAQHQEAVHAELLSHLTEKLTQTAGAVRVAAAPLRITTSLEEGDPLQTIVRLSKAPSTALIVMSTQGATNLRRRLFGTISAAVSRHAYAPVLLVPPDSRFHKPQRILIAFHEELVSNGALRTLFEFNQSFHANLQFLHIQDHSDYEVIRDKLAERLIDARLPEISFDIHDVRNTSGSVLQTLLSYAEQTQPDIIVFVTRHRNFIRSLLPIGMTRQMHAHLQWPLLVLHNA